ncbi:hypothetical protein OC846_000770 [Tilletia horrida]|uniref:Uncharacterized protein n=1 Tax=Tilletia horrida TaxID=155126 RepID=A0AAN6JUC7_9BASI|nr:hypothetical protein OC846_000770 [Tilletia horrida]KAK0569858.1 hypothetical protein OC861_000569 [Tilletia horrida]
MSAPTAIQAQPQQRSHHRQSSISSLGSAAFSFPRTAGQGVTTGPLHSPNQTRFSFQQQQQAPSSNPTDSSASASASYFDSADSAAFGAHTRAKSASVSSAISASSGSTLASTEGPSTPRLSSSFTSSSPVDRLISIASPTSPPVPTRVPSLGLGSSSYDSTKSRIISQPWAPTIGSRWVPSMTSPAVPANPPSTAASSAAVSMSRTEDVSSSGSAVSGSTAVGEGRLGSLFRKLSLSATSPSVPQFSGNVSQSSNPSPSHHHRHNSFSQPSAPASTSTFQRRSPPLFKSSSQQQQPSSPHTPQSARPATSSTNEAGFHPGGSAIPIDDLLSAGPAPANTNTSRNSFTPAVPATPPTIARSEPSRSPVMPSQPLATSPRGRKASMSGGSKLRRPSPTGERLLSMGHFGHH